MLSRTFCLLALASSLLACSKGSAQPAGDVIEESAATGEVEEEPTAPLAPTPKTSPVVDGRGGGCADADLSLPASDVVGKVNGQAISAAELGDESLAAEKDALRTYCNELDSIRSNALQRAIEDKLLGAAAREVGQDIDLYVQARLTELVDKPTDEEIAAFYEANKTPEAPPLELVADQVQQSMMQDRSRQAFAKLIDELGSDAKVQRLLPDVRPAALAVDIPAHAGTFGAQDAAIEIVEFSDFECPFCATAAEAVRAVKNNYADKVRFAYRNYPLSFHAHANLAATYAQCARRQDKFWPMHDQIFGLDSLGQETLREAAKEAKLDLKQLDECLESDEVQEEIATDMRKAAEVGVSGTPTFFINGRLHNGAPTAEGLSQAIEAELARAKG